jgi:recombinase-like protein
MSQLKPFQVRSRPPTSYEHALSDELESIYERGLHELPDVVDALNESGVRPAGGADWTEETFIAELARVAEEGRA